MRKAVLVLRVAVTVLLVVAMGLVPGQPLAGAQTQEEISTTPTLQFGCDVVKVAAIDPIFGPNHPHEHVFYGNKGVDADSTYERLAKNPDTTCRLPFATSSYWNPVVKDGTGGYLTPEKVSVYYAGSGDQTQIQPIPDGLQLLGNKENGRVDYRCGEQPPVLSPPYGCTADEFRIRVTFPECWDRSSLAPDSLVRMRGGACPSSHPYQIPTIRMSVHYKNVGGVLEGPLKVSAGGSEFLGADFFHADIFDAPQQPDFNDTIQKCVMDVADSEVPPTICRPALRTGEDTSGNTSGDTTAPTVITTTPASEAFEVRSSTTVTATFSEAMNPIALNASTFKLTKQGSTMPITAEISYDSTAKKVTLKPLVLMTSTKYTATVKGGDSGAKDEAGNPLASDIVWSFTTGEK